MEAGSRVKVAWNWTVDFFMGEVGHISEGAHPDVIICGLHAGFHPFFVLYSPRPK